MPNQLKDLIYLVVRKEEHEEDAAGDGCAASEELPQVDGVLPKVME